MGRNMIHPTILTPFNSKVASETKADLVLMGQFLDRWENGDNSAVGSMRTCASRVNSRIYYFAIDPTGKERKTASVKKAVVEAVTAAMTATGQETTQDQIEQILTLVLKKQGLA